MTQSCGLERVLVSADPDSASEFGQGKRFAWLCHAQRELGKNAAPVEGSQKHPCPRAFHRPPEGFGVGGTFFNKLNS